MVGNHWGVSVQISPGPTTKRKSALNPRAKAYERLLLVPCSVKMRRLREEETAQHPATFPCPSDPPAPKKEPTGSRSAGMVSTVFDQLGQPPAEPVEARPAMVGIQRGIQTPAAKSDEEDNDEWLYDLDRRANQTISRMTELRRELSCLEEELETIGRRTRAECPCRRSRQQASRQPTRQ